MSIQIKNLWLELVTNISIRMNWLSAREKGVENLSSTTEEANNDIQNENKNFSSRSKNICIRSNHLINKSWASFQWIKVSFMNSVRMSMKDFIWSLMTLSTLRDHIRCINIRIYDNYKQKFYRIPVICRYLKLRITKSKIC